MIITAAQLRAARGLLDWTRADLAKASGLSPETIKNIEHGIFKPMDATTASIINTFATQDVEFTENEGVHKRRKHIKTFYGFEGYIQYLDHIYEELCTSGGRIRQFNINESILDFGRDYSAKHLERMSRIQNLDARVLVPQADGKYPAPYCSYRLLISKDHTVLAPYYIYGNNVSMWGFKDKHRIEIISINSEFLAQIFDGQFESIWNASPTIDGNTITRTQ